MLQAVLPIPWPRVRPPLCRALGPLLFALLLGAPARADDLSLQLLGSVRAGSKRGPALLATVEKPAKLLRVELHSDRGKPATVVRRGLKPGREYALKLPKLPGRTHWRGKLTVRFADGSQGSMPLDFETVVTTEELTLTSDATREDVLAGHARITANRNVKKVTVRVTGEGGRDLGGGAQTFHPPAPAGTPFEVRWQMGEGEPIKIEVTAEDVDGFTRGLIFMPWEVKIPHEEVEFDTGKAVIRPDQMPKLEAVLEQLNAAIRKYGQVVEVGLYIAGHTDTVGDAAYNRKLSMQRARAIARWFRSHGVRVPIYYRGFGEEALAVPTPDETPEARNRRAEYVVSGEDPYAGQALPGRWQRLP
ncbi:MAG: OmpA family protein [Deltaproteobacteria bacterium]|nr:MAG: OmpA family protein [Deltaproteobacteria bacterium]